MLLYPFALIFTKISVFHTSGTGGPISVTGDLPTSTVSSIFSLLSNCDHCHVLPSCEISVQGGGAGGGSKMWVDIFC